MATAIAQAGNPAKSSASVPSRRFDHLFFSSMVTLMLATVFVGFAPTYYLAGVFHASLPSRIVHIHGAAFSCWVRCRAGPWLWSTETADGGAVELLFPGGSLASYDLWSTHKIHRATLWAGAFVIILQQSCYLIGPTGAWHAFANWVQTHAR